MGTMARIGTLFAAALVVFATSGALAERRQAWDDGGIAWADYESGLARAAREGKPICLVVYTTWCPHCTAYSELFRDRQVVRRARDFVMIRVDQDEREEIARQYAVDGEYIPRTYFLDPKGGITPGIDSGRDDYRFFYDTSDPAHLLDAMKRSSERSGSR